MLYYSSFCIMINTYHKERGKQMYIINNIEGEIEELKYQKEELEFKIIDLIDSEEYDEEEIDELEYHIEFINDKLKELYSLQSKEWKKEKEYEIREYWHSVL